MKSKYLYVWKTKEGYRIQTFWNEFSERVLYIGYTKKQAIKKHREKYIPKYTHLIVVEMN